MAQGWSLSSKDREFLQLVFGAAFSNPFGDERDALDRRIAGVLGAASREGLLRGVVERVTDRVSRLEGEGAHLSRCRGEDVEFLKSVFLFEAFHRYLEAFDRAILEQERAGGSPCAVPFASECISLLAGRGFSEEESLRFFALFFQLRRAFHFIDNGLVGSSASMKNVRLHLWNSVFTADLRLYALHLWNRLEDFSVLLLGETGTGKGTAAAAVGKSGFIPFDPRRGSFAESFTRSFLAINLSQYPKALVESALFGHKKGSFTGAIDHHDGVFARCSPHGAIFLDEVGDVPVPIQIKLLQVIQERTFSPVGGHERLRFRGRVVAATNQRLSKLRRTGRFRNDFYYRLCSDVVEMPPLRVRVFEDPKELTSLAEHFLREMVSNPPAELLGEVLEALGRDLGPDYPWPGNVRELEQAIRRVVLTGGYLGDTGAGGADLLESVRERVETGSLTARELLASYCGLLYQRHGTLEEVARRTRLDRRTARRYVQLGRGESRPAPDE